MAEIKLDRYTKMVKKSKENLELYKKFGVPYDPPKIGFQKSQVEDVDDRLSEMHGEMRACRECALGKLRILRKTKVVPGQGNPSAKVMIVGESPGTKEERYIGSEAPEGYGAAFVGPSGDLLNKMLHFLGLARDDVFISNVTHCRAAWKNLDRKKWEDRHPTYAEAKACWHFTKKQIELVQPWLILALGGAAANTVLEKPLDTPLNSFKDKLYSYPADTRIKVWPSYHPAYLLRDEKGSEWMRTALHWRHLRAILVKAGLT